MIEIETYPIKIVLFKDYVRVNKNLQPYVIKQSSDGTSYLAELHLVNNEYGLMDNMCYRYDDLTEEDKNIYQDRIVTIMAKYPCIKLYDKQVKKLKRKVNK